MKVVIVNGGHEADFIVKMFKQKKNNDIIVINSDKAYCDYISANLQMPVYFGVATKKYVLEETNVRDADVFIALSNSDADNYVACILAKKEFNVKKSICTVTNPKNVELFKKLGIDSVICSTYYLAETIQNESSLENVIKLLSLENEQIVLYEVLISEKYAIANKTIAEIHFPENANISCILRYPHVIIPNGATVLRPKDKLVIVSAPSNQNDVVNFIQR